MTKYTCLILDDNEIDRDAIEMHLRKIGRLEVKGAYNNGVDAVETLIHNPVDIVFSDIDMPGLSGLGLLKSFKTPPIFIFITSFTEHATESFNLDALDFIAKPATFERLLKAANKAIDYLDLKKLADNNTQSLPNPTNDNYFYVKENKGFTRLKYEEVIYIESMGDFSKIYTPTDKHITLVSLKNLERQLPSLFQRVHKQYIINLNQISTITNSEILLHHNHTVPISNSNRHELIEMMASRTLSRHTKP